MLPPMTKKKVCFLLLKRKRKRILSFDRKKCSIILLLPYSPVNNVGVRYNF